MTRREALAIIVLAVVFALGAMIPEAPTARPCRILRYATTEDSTIYNREGC